MSQQIVQQITANNNELDNVIKSGKDSPNTKKLIQQTKILVFQLPALSSNPRTADQQELLAARTFTELNVGYSLIAKDLEEFESSMSRLRIFYDNYRGFLPNSQKMNQNIALNLLYLFSYNKTIEFYSALELIPVEDITNQYIKFVIELQRAAIVGNYEEIHNSKTKSPLNEFNFFLDRILETIRYEKARSAEKAFDYLKINDAIKIFNLNNLQELQQYANNQNEEEMDNGYNWKIEGDTLYFQSTKKDQTGSNSDNLIQTALFYTSELEKIV